MKPDERTNERLTEREFSADERKALAAEGKALPDGSFPIVSVKDLEHAIEDFGRAGDEAEARRHIIKRAHQLGASDRIPYEWAQDGTTYHDHPDAPIKETANPEPQGTQAGSETTPEASSTPTTATRLHEATDILEATTDTTGKHIASVTLIRAGTSKNGNLYEPAVLRESTPMFEGVRAFADHPKDGDLPERSVRDLVGHYRNVNFDDSGRLRAELHLVPGNDWLWHLLQEAHAYPDLCGLSIDADGDVDSRTPPRRVRRFIRVNSVDIVTRPSAGGTIERILQSTPPALPESGPEGPTAGSLSAPLPPRPQPKEHALMEPTATTATETQTPITESAPQTETPPADLAKLIEAQQRELAAKTAELDRVTAILSPSTAPNSTNEATQVAELVETIKRERDLERSERILGDQLTRAALPEPVDRKIRRRFEGRIFESQLLEDTITEEKETLAALTSAGQITGMGHEKVHITSGMDAYDQLQAAFDALFDIHESEASKTIPRFSGIREAFRIATGVDPGHIGGADRPLLEGYQSGLRAHVARGNLSEAEALLREADVTNATFSYLLGTSMNKRLLKDYQAWPSEWQKFASIVAVKDFKQQDRIRLGAFGSLSTVAEDAAYTTLTLSDTRATYTPTKRGNLVQVTRETIVNDDLYAIKQIPQKLAVAAAFTLAEFVYNLLAPNFGNIYDAHPLFDSINHLNTGVIAANLNTTNSGTALASAALQTAVVAMRKQQNMASKPIGLKPRYLLVPPDLEFTAMTILKSAGLPGGSNNDVNPMMGYMEPIVAPQLNALAAGPASTKIWIAVADPRVIDTVEVGFVGGQANPVLLIQDMPLYGLNFSQDVISYKVRHEYGGAVVDYRGFYLGNN